MNNRTRSSSPARCVYYGESSYRRWVAREIGPRRVGGVYRFGDSGSAYEVLAVESGPREQWPLWQITVRTLGETGIRRHCTGWDERRDQVVAQPEDENCAGLWAAWLLAHDPHPWAARDAGPDHAEWQHLLDEIAHPATTDAFRQLAPTS